MSGKSRKKIGKVILWILAGFIALDLILVGLLFVPAIQTYAVGKVTASLSEKWKSEISVKDIHLTPTLKLVAHDFRICDYQHNDMIYVGTVKGRLRTFRLKPMKFNFGDVVLERANVVIRKYKGDENVNISIWAQNFPKHETKSTFLLTAKHLSLIDSRVTIVNDENRTVFDTRNHPDIDYDFLEFKNLNMDANKFRVQSEDITTIAAQFNHLAFNQYGGFSLTDGQADFYICDTAMVFNEMHFVTPASDLNMDLKFKYSDWQRLGDFVDSVRITANIRPTTLCMRDVAGFAPAIKGMDETFRITAKQFDGSVNDFRLSDFQTGWGFGNRLNGNLAIRNVTDFINADIQLKLDSSNVNIPELANFTLPDGARIPINNTLKKLGNTSLSCSFEGTPSFFDAEVDLVTALGTIFANLGTTAENDNIVLEGSVSAPNLNLAQLTGNSKLLGLVDAFVSIDGNVKATSIQDLDFKTLDAHLVGDLQRFDLYGYHLSNAEFEGELQNSLYNGTLSIGDPHFNCDVLAQLDISGSLPALQGNISLNNFDAGAIALKMRKIDSAKATGIDKLIYGLQQNPKMRFGFDNFNIAVRGNNLDNINGYASCDNIRIYSNDDSLSNDRLRLTAINNDNYHKYILSSGIANATLETSYQIKDLKDSLLSYAHTYCPSLVKKPNTSTAVVSNTNGYIKANLTTYRTRNITKFFVPDLYIAPNAYIDVAIANDHINDKITADIPYVGLRKKFSAFNLNISTHTETSQHINLDLRCDSIVLPLENSRLPFKTVTLNAAALNDTIQYKLNWFDVFNDTGTRSQLAGMVDVSHNNNIAINLRNSFLYIYDNDWHFNDANSIHVRKKAIDIDDLIFYNNDSHISVNGTYAQGTNNRLKINVEKINTSILNSFLGDMDIDGDVSADITVIRPKNKTVIFGKALVNDFIFNQEPIGDVFAIAGLDTMGNVNFSGGIFQKNFASAKSQLADFSISSLRNKDSIIVRLNGEYATDGKDLAIHTHFDSLNAGFLAPFLSGFSDEFKGKASGELSFYSKNKKSYFDGTVRAEDIQMGIAPLGTNYNVKGQDIRFNSEGIFFDNMKITDKDGNVAYMNGDIKHNLFQDMRINLGITTDRLLVLNTPRDVTALFYGDGYVSGDVTIRGNEDVISFKGPNLKTLNGSHIALQVTSSNSAIQSNVIHFNPKPTTKNEDGGKTDNASNSSTLLDFDFTFNVSNETELELFLESIGGTMNARANGKFQLTYNDNEDVNLYGNLDIHSGDFKISLFNVINSKFTLVPEGKILFDGPLENMLVNVSAYKSSKTSLTDILPQGSAVGNNVTVNAYLHLNGYLMQRIEPTFSFELPHSQEELSNLFFTAIDTTNTENLTKQFAYFLVTNNFLPNSTASADRYGSGGINMFRNIVNNMIGSLISSKNLSFGITYNQESQTTSAEYGITGSANLLNNRVTMETSIGYYDNKNNQNNANNMYGDFSVEYSINPQGTWKVKAYTYLGQHEEDYIPHDNQVNYTAGVALAFKQDFNTKRRRQKVTRKKTKNEHDQKQ